MYTRLQATPPSNVHYYIPNVFYAYVFLVFGINKKHKVREVEKKISDRIGINDSANKKVQKKVDLIISSIRKDGDKALMGFIKKFDNYDIKRIKDILISSDEIKEAYTYVDKLQVSNLKKSIKRIRDFSKKQKAESWSDTLSKAT
mgnify:CR=1 FL=1